MLDSKLREIIDAPLAVMAQPLAKCGITANKITMGGAIAGVMAIICIASESYGWGLTFLILNRLADGLDGALARINGPTDYGGFLDIVVDFLFYNGMVFGFVMANPTTNGLPGAFLLLSFVGTGITFLAFAILAAKRGVSTQRRGNKSFYYVGGLMEGTETALFMITMCLLPTYFPTFAWICAAACWLTTVGRLIMAKQLFDDGRHTPDLNEN